MSLGALAKTSGTYKASKDAGKDPTAITRTLRKTVRNIWHIQGFYGPW